MTRLVRPHIPLAVRCQVAARQLQQRDGGLKNVLIADLAESHSARLAYLLFCLFGDEPAHLDHDPSLCLRHIIDEEKGLYDPPANSVEHLIYRTEADHRTKTFIRGDGAQLSDAGKRRKEIKRNRKKPPSRWPPRGSRPMRGGT